MLGIGIDTGGTYTDAVLYDFDRKEVLAKSKALTTKENLEKGILEALDALPEEKIREASLLSLSTTLATNACVEKKGGRAKLILLGTNDKVLHWVDAGSRYGLEEQNVLCLDSDSVFEPIGEEPPLWYQQLMEEKKWLSDAQALAIAEVPAMRNGAAGEKYAREHIQQQYPVPFVAASDMALGLNIMERGATALLNARLLPVVDEFLKAVKKALKQRGMDIRQMIVRSDGSLMSEEFAGVYPVQTILSGPAASVIGSRNLAKEKNCLIVDMGGTTTDISIVRDGVPTMSERIAIGGYKTQIRGVYIETVGLGGDSRITAANKQLALNVRRVQPLCVAAHQYPQIISQLEGLAAAHTPHTQPLHEFLYLVRRPEHPENYTQAEQELIDALSDGPVMLGSRKLDIYNLSSDRLENEGIVMRCGLTPTDIMHIRGDFSKYDKTASELGARCVMANLLDYQDGDLQRFCEEAYDMVCGKLYESIVRTFLLSQYPDIFADGMSEQVAELIRQTWKRKGKAEFFGLKFDTGASLVGIGAPTHIFLPHVAEVLGVPCVIAPHAEVANAVGAVTSEIAAQYRVRISPVSGQEAEGNFVAYLPEGQKLFEEREQAIEAAKAAAKAGAEHRARERGALGELEFSTDVSTASVKTAYGTELLLDTVVTVQAAPGRARPAAISSRTVPTHNGRGTSR